MSAQLSRTFTLADAASTLLGSGLSVIPIASLAEKNPALPSWKPYTERAVDAELARSWFEDNGPRTPEGIGVVCGKVSGNLTVIDFDVAEDGTCLFQDWCDLVNQVDNGLLLTLPLVSTPSGGYHVYLRADACERNTKLAMGRNGQVLIETRGEGGYVLAPPTPGYVRAENSIRHVPAVRPPVRALLLDCAKALTAEPPTHPRHLDRAAVLPGDAYNTRATMESVLDLLKLHSWTVAGRSSDSVLLRRPGKDRGSSASLTDLSGMPVFYCFSTSVPNVPSGQGLSPFGLYTHLVHGGDYAAAAGAIAKEYALPAAAHPGSLHVVPRAQRPSWRDLCFNGADLFKQQFDPVEFVVEGVVPPGLTLFAAPPKCGKSWMAWNIALAVATGTLALGSVGVRRRHVLYLMLEEGKRLVNARMHKLVDEGADLSWLECSQAWRKLTDDGAEMINDFCSEFPDALVVVDTYESLRGSIENGRDSYQNDYGALKPLHDLCKDKEWSVLVIHHTNKRGGDDPFNSINGSNGIAGCVDTLGVMARRNDSDEVVLHLRGRELDSDQHLMLEFDAANGGHKLLGDAGDVGKNRQQQAIVDFLMGEPGPCSPKEIAQGVGRDDDSAMRHQLGRMVDAGILLKSDYGRYSARAQSDTCDTSLQGACIDTPAAAPLIQGSVTVVTPVTPGEPPVEPVIPVTVEAVAPVQLAMRTETCAKCGKSTPYWAELAPGEKPYCPTCTPKRRRK